MNFGAHVLVAAQVVPDAPTGVLLGAAGPDLVRMAGLRLAEDAPTEVTAGIAVHHRTDAAFHDLAWFREQNRATSASLQDRGVRRGPARGAAHVLVELLLDGALLAEGPEPFGRFWAALGQPSDEAMALVGPDDRAHWRGLLDQLTTRLEPRRYADPAYAADRTAGTLARRPRLALADDEPVALYEVASALATSVVEDAARVLDDVTRQLEDDAAHPG